MKSLLDKVNTKLNAQGGFLKAVSVLVGGTAFAQLITIAILPILTRLYTPNEFSILAIYTALLSLITPIACLRFQIAIPLPKSNEKGRALLKLSLLSVCLVNFMLILLIYIAMDWINHITQNRLENYLWLLPVGVMLSGVYSAFQYWETRQKNFKIISKTRINQAISGSLTQVGLGFWGVGVVGLLIGQLLNVGAGIWTLIKSFFNVPYTKNETIKLNQLIREYQDFPKYSTFEALANSATVQVPILLVAVYVVGSEVGFIMLAIRLLAAPMGLIGGAISQVYLSEAPVQYHQGNLKAFTYKTIKILIKIGAPPLVLIGLLSPYLIGFIFGESWGRTGELIAWMTPWFLMQFITSPISMILHIKNQQKIALILQIVGLIIRAGGVFFASIYFSKYIGEVFALTGFIFYLLYFFIILFVLRDKSNEV